MSAANPKLQIPRPKSQRFQRRMLTSLRAFRRGSTLEVEGDQQVLVGDDAAVDRRDPLGIQLQLVHLLYELRGVIGPALRRANLVAGWWVVAVAVHQHALL